MGRETFVPWPAVGQVGGIEWESCSWCLLPGLLWGSHVTSHGDMSPGAGAVCTDAVRFMAFSAQNLVWSSGFAVCLACPPAQVFFACLPPSGFDPCPFSGPVLLQPFSDRVAPGCECWVWGCARPWMALWFWAHRSAGSCSLRYPLGITWPGEWRLVLCGASRKVSQPTGGDHTLLPFSFLLSARWFSSRVGRGDTQGAD